MDVRVLHVVISLMLFWELNVVQPINGTYHLEHILYLVFYCGKASDTASDQPV